MAASKQRFVMTMATAGVPIDTVTLAPDGLSAEYTLLPGSSPEQAALAAQVYGDFQWTDAAEAAYQAGLNTERTVALLKSPDPEQRAPRAGIFATVFSLQEVRAVVKELVAALKAGDQSRIQALPDIQTGDSQEEATATVEYLIRAGVL